MSSIQGNTIQGGSNKFTLFRDFNGNITINFTQKRLTDWRNTFSQLRHWAVAASVGADRRRQFTQLSPPFILEDEGLIFDTNIGSSRQVSLKNIQYKNVLLKSGDVLAAESRLIFGDVQKNVIDQVPYKDIRMVNYEQYKDPTTITLTLADNIELKMLLHLSKTSILWSVATVVLGTFDPGGARNITQGNIRDGANARDFLSDFIKFFNEIADENRTRRKGQ